MKYPTCSLIGRTAFSVMSANNKKTLIINTGPIVTETFTLNDIDEGWLWSEFLKCITKIYPFLLISKIKFQ